MAARRILRLRQGIDFGQFLRGFDGGFGAAVNHKTTPEEKYCHRSVSVQMTVAQRWMASYRHSAGRSDDWRESLMAQFAMEAAPETMQTVELLIWAVYNGYLWTLYTWKY